MKHRTSKMYTEVTVRLSSYTDLGTWDSIPGSAIFGILLTNSYCDIVFC